MTNVHVLAFTDNHVILCRDARDVWFLPGGAREAGESIAECAARELIEEAGAILTGPLQTVGAHYCLSYQAAPYRPHQPHPMKAWLWCLSDATLAGKPTIPDGGEQVVEVQAVDIDQAGPLLLSDEPWLPELLALAVEVRTTATAASGRTQDGELPSRIIVSKRRPR